MSINNLPPTRENLAASSGEWVVLVDCFECTNGVYLDGQCTQCGARAPRAVAKVIEELSAPKNAA